MKQGQGWHYYAKIEKLNFSIRFLFPRKIDKITENFGLPYLVSSKQKNESEKTFTGFVVRNTKTNMLSFYTV